MFVLSLIDRVQSIPKLYSDPCPSPCLDTRTTWNVVLSSLVTIFVCIWVVVRPNVPAFADGTFARIKQRAKLLLTAVVAPEVIALFAMRQWVCARAVMHSAFARENKWTWSHGFFLIMGGFVLYESDGEQPLYPLDLENIEQLTQSGAIDFPKIDEKEIQDRSKGDIVSKGLAILQPGWFIMQCIVRGTGHLAITQLEIMTIAFIFLNLVTYVFWWNKPRNVTCPIRIVLKKGHYAPEPPKQEKFSFWDRFVQMFTLVDPDQDLDVNLLREKRVPTFYAGRIEGKPYFALWTAEMMVAMISGGIHCIAWSFSFPTHMEQTIWRVSSIAIISIPFTVLVFAVLLKFLDFEIPDILFALLAIGFPSALMYPFARVVLMVLSFISLRSLPPSAFYAVRWTSFVPHV